jgi:hypothetical protein
MVRCSSSVNSLWPFPNTAEGRGGNASRVFSNAFKSYKRHSEPGGRGRDPLGDCLNRERHGREISLVSPALLAFSRWMAVENMFEY